jgi:hypothetical protein
MTSYFMFANELDCLLHNFNLLFSVVMTRLNTRHVSMPQVPLSSVKLDFLAVGSMLIDSSIFLIITTQHPCETCSVVHQAKNNSLQ